MGSSASLAFTRRARAAAPQLTPGLTHIDYGLPRFVATVTQAVNSAPRTPEAISHDAAEFAEVGLEKVVAPSTEWTGGENAANNNECALGAREAA